MIEKDNPFAEAHRAITIVQHLDIKPGMKILDAGCGPGRVTIPLAKAVGKDGEIVAMDIQAGMLVRAEKKAKLENLTNIKFLQAGLGENKLEKNMFDRVVLVTVLGEIPNKESALQEIFSALKSRGILSITETIFDPPHYQKMTTVLQLVKKIGFKEKERYGNIVAYTINKKKPE
ncbi:MAG: methyltransferase domain-containing protein [Gammaproteobacteria bacterium]|nr:methyltransferase domain-containing protein [Gammaproteobacteria bacterium]